MRRNADCLGRHCAYRVDLDPHAGRRRSPAPALLKALSGLLDMLPIAYMIRVETTDEHVLQHVSPKIAAWDQAGSIGPTDAARPVIES